MHQKGSKPVFTEHTPVSEDTEIKKNELYLFEGEDNLYFPEGGFPDRNKLETNFINKLWGDLEAEEGAKPIWVYVNIEDRIQEGTGLLYWHVDIKFVVTSNPVPLFVWLIISIAVAAAIFAIGISIALVIHRVGTLAAGVAGGVGGLIIVVVFLVMLFWFLSQREKRTRKRKR